MEDGVLSRAPGYPGATVASLPAKPLAGIHRPWTSGDAFWLRTVCSDRRGLYAAKA